MYSNTNGRERRSRMASFTRPTTYDHEARVRALLAQPNPAEEEGMIYETALAQGHEGLARMSLVKQADMKRRFITERFFATEERSRQIPAPPSLASALMIINAAATPWEDERDPATGHQEVVQPGAPIVDNDRLSVADLRPLSVADGDEAAAQYDSERDGLFDAEGSVDVAPLDEDFVEADAVYEEAGSYDANGFQEYDGTDVIHAMHAENDGGVNDEETFDDEYYDMAEDERMEADGEYDGSFEDEEQHPFPVDDVEEYNGGDVLLEGVDEEEFEEADQTDNVMDVPDEELDIEGGFEHDAAATDGYVMSTVQVDMPDDVNDSGASHLAYPRAPTPFSDEDVEPLEFDQTLDDLGQVLLDDLEEMQYVEDDDGPGDPAANETFGDALDDAYFHWDDEVQPDIVQDASTEPATTYDVEFSYPPLPSPPIEAPESSSLPSSDQPSSLPAVEPFRIPDEMPAPLDGSQEGAPADSDFAEFGDASLTALASIDIPRPESRGEHVEDSFVQGTLDEALAAAGVPSPSAGDALPLEPPAEYDFDAWLLAAQEQEGEFHDLQNMAPDPAEEVAEDEVSYRAPSPPAEKLAQPTEEFMPPSASPEPTAVEADVVEEAEEGSPQEVFAEEDSPEFADADATEDSATPPVVLEDATDGIAGEDDADMDEEDIELQVRPLSSGSGVELLPDDLQPLSPQSYEQQPGNAAPLDQPVIQEPTFSLSDADASGDFGAELAMDDPADSDNEADVVVVSSDEDTEDKAALQLVHGEGEGEEEQTPDTSDSHGEVAASDLSADVDVEVYLPAADISVANLPELVANATAVDEHKSGTMEAEAPMAAASDGVLDASDLLQTQDFELDEEVGIEAVQTQELDEALLVGATAPSRDAEDALALLDFPTGSLPGAISPRDEDNVQDIAQDDGPTPTATAALVDPNDVSHLEESLADSEVLPQSPADNTQEAFGEWLAVSRSSDEETEIDNLVEVSPFQEAVVDVQDEAEVEDYLLHGTPSPVEQQLSRETSLDSFRESSPEPTTFAHSFAEESLSASETSSVQDDVELSDDDSSVPVEGPSAGTSSEAEVAPTEEELSAEAVELLTEIFGSDSDSSGPASSPTQRPPRPVLSVNTGATPPPPPSTQGGTDESRDPSLGPSTRSSGTVQGRNTRQPSSDQHLASGSSGLRRRPFAIFGEGDYSYEIVEYVPVDEAARDNGELDDEGRRDYQSAMLRSFEDMRKESADDHAGVGEDAAKRDDEDEERERRYFETPEPSDEGYVEDEEVLRVITGDEAPAGATQEPQLELSREYAETAAVAGEEAGEADVPFPGLPPLSVEPVVLEEDGPVGEGDGVEFESETAGRSDEAFNEVPDALAGEGPEPEFRPSYSYDALEEHAHQDASHFDHSAEDSVVQDGASSSELTEEESRDRSTSAFEQEPSPRGLSSEEAAEYILDDHEHEDVALHHHDSPVPPRVEDVMEPAPAVAGPSLEPPVLQRAPPSFNYKSRVLRSQCYWQKVRVKVPRHTPRVFLVPYCYVDPTRFSPTVINLGKASVANLRSSSSDLTVVPTEVLHELRTFQTGSLVEEYARVLPLPRNGKAPAGSIDGDEEDDKKPRQARRTPAQKRKREEDDTPASYPAKKPRQSHARRLSELKSSPDPPVRGRRGAGRASTGSPAVLAKLRSSVRADTPRPDREAEGSSLRRSPRFRSSAESGDTKGKATLAQKRKRDDEEEEEEEGGQSSSSGGHWLRSSGKKRKRDSDADDIKEEDEEDGKGWSRKGPAKRRR